MKKQFSILAVAMALLMSVTSCSKDTGSGVDLSNKGSLKVTVGFKETLNARATEVSTAKPVTSWVKNIKNMKLVLVSPSTSRIVDIRSIKLSAQVDHLNYKPEIFEGIVSDTYDVYVIANIDRTDSPMATGTATAQSIAIGDLISKVYLLTEVKPWLTTDASPVTGHEASGSTGYSEPAEIFIAKKTGVVVPGSGNNVDAGVLDLTRAVSLLRIRIDKSDAVNAAQINFSDVSGDGIRLRRIAKSMSYNGILAGKTNGDVLYSVKPFQTAAQYDAKVATGDYAGLMFPTDVNNNYTLWNDYLILPGGADNVESGFNIVLTGKTTIDDYVTSLGNKVPSGTMVWWQGTITKAIAANGILDVSIKITTPGTDGPDIPPVNDYGTLTIEMDLIDWNLPTLVELPL